MLKNDRNILEHILSEIEVADRLLEGISYEAFESNEEKKRAVAMTLWTAVSAF